MRNATVGYLKLFHCQLYRRSASLCHLQFCQVFGRRGPSPIMQKAASYPHPHPPPPPDKGVANNVKVFKVFFFFFIKISLGVTHLVISFHYVFKAHNGPRFAQYRPSLLFLFWKTAACRLASNCSG